MLLVVLVQAKGASQLEHWRWRAGRLQVSMQLSGINGHKKNLQLLVMCWARLGSNT